MWNLKKAKKLIRESGSPGFLILNLKAYLLTCIENRPTKTSHDGKEKSSNTQDGYRRLPDGNKTIYPWKDHDEIDFIVNEIYRLGVYHHKGCPVEGQIIIDIGGHIGIYTLNAAKKVGTHGKVITIEPSPDNYRMLTNNIMVNHLDNVTVINTALASSEGKGKLYLSGSGRHSLMSKDKSEFVETSLTTLDHLVEKLGLPYIDTVKIDVEGSEMEVLKGSTNALKSKIKRLVIAAYHYPSEADEITKYLKIVAPHLKVELFPSQEGHDTDIYLYAS